MSSIDDLFRIPNAPPKRKLEDPLRAQQSYKSAKHSDGASPHSHFYANGSTSSRGSNGLPKVASVEDEAADDDEDVEAGPSLPPDEDDEGDDEDGRFFGGGVSKEQRQVLDLVDELGDNADADTAEKIDSAWLRKTAISFERKINKNAEQRAKYSEDPTRFMASEADLDSDIKGLSILTEHTELYPEFAKLGCIGSLVSLLAHENTDISISAMLVLSELTDETTGGDESEWRSVVDAMVDADVIDLLVQNLSRLDEREEADRDGVYHVLSVVENLLSDSRGSAMARRIGSGNSQMLTWLSSRIADTAHDSSATETVSQNRQYASEILAILLQSSSTNRHTFVGIDGVDKLLTLLSTYRHRDPAKSSNEEEFMANLFDCLTCVVDEDAGKEKFLTAEGVELMLILARSSTRIAKSRALLVVDHACAPLSADSLMASSVCEKIVEAAGLKTLFGIFMKKSMPPPSSEAAARSQSNTERMNTEYVLNILASLLRYLPAQSPARIRTLAKFVEKDYEKPVRLIQVRADYAVKVQRAEAAIDSELAGTGTRTEAEHAELRLSRRIDAGLTVLRTVYVLLAWIVAEDGGARKAIAAVLPLAELRANLNEQRAELAAVVDAPSTEDDDADDADSDPESKDADAKTRAQAADTLEMLDALLACL